MGLSNPNLCDFWNSLKKGLGQQCRQLQATCYLLDQYTQLEQESPFNTVGVGGKRSVLYGGKEETSGRKEEAQKAAAVSGKRMWGDGPQGHMLGDRKMGTQTPASLGWFLFQGKAVLAFTALRKQLFLLPFSSTSLQEPGN